MPEEAETEAGTARPGGRRHSPHSKKLYTGRTLSTRCMYSCRMHTSDFPLGLMTNSVTCRQGCLRTAGARLWRAPLRRRADGAGLTFLRGRVLHRQCDELLVGGQDGPL